MRQRFLRQDDAPFSRCSRRPLWASWTVALAVSLAIGCGDSGEATAGAGGGGGAGGTTAGASGGGSGGTAGVKPGDGGPRDGPSPPAAMGAVSLHLAEPDDMTIRCTPGRQWVNAPSTPVPVQTQQTSAAEIGPRAVDGASAGAVRVVCSVRKSGDKYEFLADITTPRTDGATMLHPTILHFEASGIAPNGPAAVGTIRAMTDSTLANFADEACEFSVTSQGGATTIGVAPGRIWTSVTCQRLTHPSQSDNVCRVDVGFAVFENCAQ